MVVVELDKLMKQIKKYCAIAIVLSVAAFNLWLAVGNHGKGRVIFSNVEALAYIESPSIDEFIDEVLNDKKYQKCVVGERLMLGVSSQGVIALYCGDCIAGRIWPNGDGYCRLY